MKESLPINTFLNFISNNPYKIMLQEFKNKVDNCIATIKSSDLLDGCNILGIDTSFSYSGTDVTKKLYQIISESITCDNREVLDLISKKDFFKLKSELVYRYVLYNEIPFEYLEVLEVIKSSCGSDAYFFPFSETIKWENAIVHSKSFNSFSPHTYSRSILNLRDMYPRDFDRAISVKKLMEKGCEIDIVNSEINITSGLDILERELNDKIKKIGGITLIKIFFSHLNKIGSYSKRFERYLIRRKASGTSIDQAPQIPFGYLLNLSLKHPIESETSTVNDTLLQEIIDLAIIITNGVYGVQHYNYWVYHFQSGETIVKFCTEIALWDSMFSIPQCRPTSALEITNELFSFIDDETFKKSLGFTRQEFISVAQEIYLIATNPHLPSIIYYSAIKKGLKQIDASLILQILNFLSHYLQINENYFSPSDYSSIDFGQKPLIRLTETKFILINRSWCAPNFFESVATQLREKFKSLKRDFDIELGKQLEMVLQNKLTARGITFCTGDYEVDGVDGQCDFLIETDKAIVIIESKKKTLTRKSKSGIDINLLLDLCDSILDAQFQAGKVEVILREKGSISLIEKNEITSNISLNNRQVERVALTQLEFGGFQDRTILNTFLKSLLTHSYGTNSTDTDIIKKFNKLEKKRLLWVEQYNKLVNLDKAFAHFPYFNCWFLSLPQLIEIINLSTDNNSFYEIFSKTKHVSLSTLEWYTEFGYATGGI